MTSNDLTLTFDIVIATRNRQDVLSDSIPLMLGQSRQAESLIIVDSSDDHGPVKSVVEELTKDWSGKVTIVHQKKPSITLQRNIGLEYVNADVVMFPDDDSLWHPGVAESTMRVYEADTSKQVGGVCAKPVTQSPLSDSQMAYKKSFSSTLKVFVQPLRNFLEEALFPKPFNLYAEERWKVLPGLSWLDDQNACLVPIMTGFRMTFRSDLIKQLKFDETIGSRVGYAPCEDMEASVKILKSGHLLVAALDAHVFHHRHPSPRAPAYNYGLSQIINYLYTVSKHFDRNAKSWNATQRYVRYKVFLYWLGSFNPNKKKLYKGSLAGWQNRKAFLDAKPAELDDIYAQVCNKTMSD